MLRKTFSLISAMAGVYRFSMIRLTHPENVLEHTGAVVLLCYVIGSHCNKLGCDLNMATLLSKAALHDIDETITGDIPRPTKYFSKPLRDAFAELEKRGARNISIAFDLPEIARLHQTAKSGPEGFVVAFADMLAAAQRVWEEVKVYNNHHMIRPAHNLRRALEQLVREHIESTPFIARPFIRELYYTAEAMLKEVCAADGHEYVELHT